MQNELDALRTEIDEIDAQILLLFKRRMETAARVAEYKRRTCGAVLQGGREQEILERVQREAGAELAPYARELFTELMRLSRNYQKELLGGFTDTTKT